MRTLIGLVVAVVLLAGPVACTRSTSDGAEATTTSSATTVSTDSSGASTPSVSTGPTTTAEGSVTDDPDAYAGALAQTLLTTDSAAAGRLVLNDEQADCVASKWVSLIGVDTFSEAEVAPADVLEPTFKLASLGLDTDQGAEMIVALEDCGVEIYSQLLDVLTTDLDATQTACLKRAFDEDLARQFLSEFFTQADLSSDLAKTLDGIDTSCALSTP